MIRIVYFLSISILLAVSPTFAQENEDPSYYWDGNFSIAATQHTERVIILAGIFQDYVDMDGYRLPGKEEPSVFLSAYSAEGNQFLWALQIESPQAIDNVGLVFGSMGSMLLIEVGGRSLLIPFDADFKTDSPQIFRVAPDDGLNDFNEIEYSAKPSFYRGLAAHKIDPQASPLDVGNSNPGSGPGGLSDNTESSDDPNGGPLSSAPDGRYGNSQGHEIPDYRP